MSQPADVPSSVDYRLMADAAEWETAAMEKRPWRAEFFERMVEAVATSQRPVRSVLELGSGPGFLAAHFLARLPQIAYVALDYSPAMHQLAARRLGPEAARVQFVERSFKEPEWVAELGPFDCVVTNQAVHELRHKRYALALHKQVRQVLAPGGIYLVSDHFLGEGGMTKDQLYMTVEEQRDCLVAAGFGSVTQLLCKGGLVLHAAM